MEKINALLRKYVAEVAIILTVVGIISNVLVKYVRAAGVFGVVHLNDPLKVFMRPFINEPAAVDFLTYVFFLMLGVGAYHYIKSKGGDSRLLKFCFSIIAIKNLIALVSLPFNYYYIQKIVQKYNTVSAQDINIMDFVYPSLINIPLIYICLYLCRWLIKQRQVDYSAEENEKGNLEYSFIVPPNSTRFTHLIFDMYLTSILFFSIFSKAIFLIGENFQFGRTSIQFLSSQRIVMSLVFGVLIITYYLIFESIFQATPLKFLTSTRVVRSDDLGKPSFAMILGRSICRRIPFEPFSFFGENGWHDSLSNTTVVYVKNEGRVNFKHGLWIVLLVLQFLGVIGYTTFNDKMQKIKRESISTTVKAQQKKADFYYLNAGDLLVLKEESDNYKKDLSLISINKVEGQEITGDKYSVGYKDKIERRSFLEKGIEEHWQFVEQIKLVKSELSEAILSTEYRTKVTIRDTLFRLKEFIDTENPRFKSSSSSGKMEGNTLTTTHDINFNGLNLEIIGFEPIDGNVEWLDELPIRPRYQDDKKSGYFGLEGKGSATRMSKTRMKVRCQGREMSYLIYKLGSKIEFVLEVPEQ